MKVLYKDTFNDPKIYALNTGYWTRILKRMNIKKPDRFRLYCKLEYRKDLPIYVCTDGQRYLRIIQFDMYESEGYEKYTYLTAWKDVYRYNNEEYPELVVCILLSKEYIKIILPLIDCWFRKDDNNVDNIIAKIYSMQEINTTKYNENV